MESRVPNMPGPNGIEATQQTSASRCLTVQSITALNITDYAAGYDDCPSDLSVVTMTDGEIDAIMGGVRS